MQVLRQAQCVRHERYGIGFVKESNSERTTIEFDDHGPKKFVTSLLVVELLAGEAPAKPPASRRRRKTAATIAAAATGAH